MNAEAQLFLDAIIVRRILLAANPSHDWSLAPFLNPVLLTTTLRVCTLAELQQGTAIWVSPSLQLHFVVAALF
jgi:hypothetical protein